MRGRWMDGHRVDGGWMEKEAKAEKESGEGRRGFLVVIFSDGPFFSSFRLHWD